MKATKAKRVYRLPPCPEYDMEAMQSWLSDMAAKGYYLVPADIWFGLFAFEKGPSRSVRYRLEAAPKHASSLNEYDQPDEAAIQLNADFGWDYITRRGQFYIYATSDPNAVEMNTDPQIQEQNLQALSRRMRDELVWMPAHFLLLYFLFYHGSILTFCTFTAALWVYGLLAACWLLSLCERIVSFIHMMKLRKRLMSGSTLTEPVDWKKSSSAYRLYRAGRSLMTLAFIAALCCFMAVNLPGENEIPLSEYTDPLPFATLADFYPGGQLIEDSGLVDCTIRSWGNVVSPENYEYREYCDLALPDGTTVINHLTILYHHTASAAIARGLASEHEYRDLKKAFNAYDYEMVDLEPTGADSCVCYHDGLFWVIVMRKGNIVLRASMWVVQDPSFDPQHFADVLAASMG